MRQRLGLADRLSSRDIAQIFVQILVQHYYLTNHEMPIRQNAQRGCGIVVHFNESSNCQVVMLHKV